MNSRQKYFFLCLCYFFLFAFVLCNHIFCCCSLLFGGLFVSSFVLVGGRNWWEFLFALMKMKSSERIFCQTSLLTQINPVSYVLTINWRNRRMKYILLSSVSMNTDTDLWYSVGMNINILLLLE